PLTTARPKRCRAYGGVDRRPCCAHKSCDVHVHRDLAPSRQSPHVASQAALVSPSRTKIEHPHGRSTLVPSLRVGELLSHYRTVRGSAHRPAVRGDCAGGRGWNG